jgi:hypothetical protein
MTKYFLTIFMFATLLLTGCGKDEPATSGVALPMNGQVGQMDGILRIPKQGVTGIQPTFVYAGQNFSFAQNTSSQVIQQIYQLYYSANTTGMMNGNSFGYQVVENNASYTSYRARVSGSVIQPQQMQNVGMTQSLVQANTMMPY